MKNIQYLTSIVISLLLLGCTGTGATYVPIVDGPRDRIFTSDLAACQQLAEERTYMNADVRNDAIVGGVIGGILGLLDDGELDDAAGGAAAGAAIGGGSRAYEVIEERKNIVKRCMLQRGHNVVG